jgi:hypothetical protein
MVAHRDIADSMEYAPSPCDGDGPRASGSGAYGLLQPCILGTLIDAMRTTLVVMWAGDCARQSVIVSPVLGRFLAAREAAVAPHAKSHKELPPTAMSM